MLSSQAAGPSAPGGGQRSFRPGEAAGSVSPSVSHVGRISAVLFFYYYFTLFFILIARSGVWEAKSKNVLRGKHTDRGLSPKSRKNIIRWILKL